MTEIQQANVRRRADFVCEQPYPDDEVIFHWSEQGPDTYIFYNDTWLLVYNLVDEGAVVEIWLLAPAGWLRPPSLVSTQLSETRGVVATAPVRNRP